ncbi:MAG: hypothetical protein H6718_08630 [Polyangiaceae bacterium]|nr:hypothetical protein [Polyangiaceae bacterium]MCB9606535.1 hypothetical protein [Polyangiaceae bacterium]
MLGRTWARRALGTSLISGLALLASAGDAHAFSTRIHIMIANDIRKELIAGGGNSVALKLSGYSVSLSEEDARAIRDNPLEFRAGAIGPDNTVFPGMTDPSHALHQQPYAQCQLLYDEALTDAERAYALGCFLHGSTDAIAHHYVNYMSGETFTLTPITSARQSSWDNVVRHIVAESQIQKAAYEQSPSAFGAGTLAHTIPQGFVLRTYFGTQNPVWLAMTEHARAKFEAAKSANPGASFVSIVNSAELPAADHLALAPFYIEEIDRERLDIRLDIETRIAELQDPSTADGFELGVTAGSDGQLGTPDDQTDCDFSCPVLFSTYKTYVAMLTPRFDANNQPLPSAFDKLSEKLHDDLYGFMPAYAQTVTGLSTELNSPLTPGAPQFSLSKSRLGVLMQPMKDWANNITNLDYETVAQAVLPQWYLDLQSTLETLGINIPPADIIRAVFDPIVQPIKDTLKDKAIDLAEEYVGTLIDELEAKEDAVLSEYDTRLSAAADPNLNGTALDNLFDSGLYAHAFNIAAVTFADHRMVVPASGDQGPASFDASHTPAWMQPGVCDYLRPAVFPLGIDTKALLSVRKDGTDYPATITEDAPVECHSGKLESFAPNASTADCAVTDLAALILDPGHQGSVSRAFPPGLSDAPATCLNVAVPGLPDPPANPSGGAGGTAGTAGTGGDAGNPSGGSAGASGSPGNNASGGGDDGGCGCRTTGGGDSHGSTALLFGLGLLALRRRRRG